MRAVILLLRVVALALVLLAGHVLGAVLAGFSHQPDRGGTGAAEVAEKAATDPAQALTLLGMVLLVCALEASVLAYPILRSRWGGWKLVGAVFLVIFGVVTVQPQLETAFFGVLSPRMLMRIILMGAVMAAFVAPISVAVLGRWKADPSGPPPDGRDLPAGQWAWRLAVTAVFYVILYSAFGHLVAWQSPAVREFYGAESSTGSLGEIGLLTIPWLGPFQAARALLWVGLAIPVLRMVRGGFWHAALAVALLFAVLMNAQLLLPNDYMPRDVRMVHLAETASSNFILGLFIAWLFYRRIGTGTN